MPTVEKPWLCHRPTAGMGWKGPERRSAPEAGTADRPVLRAQHQGPVRRDHDQGGFERYWWFTATSPGPENKVTERLALAQIWPRLHPHHQQVLAALADHNDHGLAASSFGISRRMFTHQLSDARPAFLKHWHEGESPSRIWCTGKTTAIWRRRARRARRAAETGQPLRPTPGARPRADLGISDAELVRRCHAGESIRQLAAALGTYYSVVHTRLLAEGAQLRPAKGQPPAHRSR